MDLVEEGALLPAKQCYWPRGPQQTSKKSTSAKQADALQQLPKDLYLVFQWQSNEQRQGVLRIGAVCMGSTVLATPVVMVPMVT